MFEAFIASLGYTGGVLADKVILSKYKVPVLRFIPLLFVWLALITAVFLPRFGGIKTDLFTWKTVILFLGMIVIAVIWNVFYYHGIQKEDLHEFELIMLLSPLVTIMMAELFLPAERNLTVFIAGIIASFALIFARFKSHHVRISRVAKQTMLAMILLSFESILIKELLIVFSPVTLYFVRTTAIATVFLIFIRPKILKLPTMAFALTILSAMFGVVQMVLKFYGFKNLGIIETTMILILGPFLVYMASSVFFKEKFYKRDVAAAIVAILCILYVQFWQ
jgi:drug/metabolite transporter (DMT)-like permease